MNLPMRQSEVRAARHTPMGEYERALHERWKAARIGLRAVPAPKPWRHGLPPNAKFVTLAEEPQLDYGLPKPSGLAKVSRTAARQIVTDVCKQHGVQERVVLSDQRSRAITAVRQEIMWRMTHETHLSLPAIGRMLNRDHTTVLHGIRKYAAVHGLPLEGRGAFGPKITRQKCLSMHADGENPLGISTAVGG